MRASRNFPLRFLVVVFANILTTYAGSTEFYFFSNLLTVKENGERMNFQSDDNQDVCVSGKLPDDWQLSLPTCLLIHGYFEDPRDKGTSAVLIKEALLKTKRQCNIVIVDWHLTGPVGGQVLRTQWQKRGEEEDESVALNLNLKTASEALEVGFNKSVPDSICQVALFIVWLRKNVRAQNGFNVQGLKVTAFAHGMGGQVIGGAAHLLGKTHNESPIETIIATDPTCRHSNEGIILDKPDATYLRKSSAHRVVVILTNTGGFGSEAVEAHLVVYINNKFIKLQENAADYRNIVLEFLQSLRSVHVQQGFLEEKKRIENLLFSHDQAFKYLAAQIMNPTKVIVDTDQANGVINLFGEDLEVEKLPPDGLRIQLSWKGSADPKLITDNFVMWNNSDDAVPILSDLTTLDCKPVIYSDFQGLKVACPAEADLNPTEINILPTEESEKEAEGLVF